MREACGVGVGNREKVKRGDGGKVTKIDEVVTREDFNYLYFNLRLSH